MTRTPLVCALLLCAAALPAVVQAQHAQHGAHEWDYDGATTGPEAWGGIKSDYSSCKLGQAQSPIDIRATSKEKLPAIAFDYKASPLKLIDNGHTVQVNYAAGSGITVAGSHYDLLQFHFHTPSEERIQGKSYPLVAHMVHKNAEGKLAVVALLFTPGKENPLLTTIWGKLPTEKGKEVRVDGTTVDLAAALPASRGYYQFAGSLTTPPCSENVSWYVLKTPVEMSAAQIAQFHGVYQHNARPVQPLNGRVVKESAD